MGRNSAARTASSAKAVANEGRGDSVVTMGAADNPGLVLRQIRTENDWTLAQVSQKVGLPVSTLSKVETGKMSLSYDKLLKISRGLNIDIARLFMREAPEPALSWTKS